MDLMRPNNKRITVCCAIVYGCKNLDGTLKHAVVRRHGDTTSVRCLATGETFFLTCIDSRWVGELNNCSAPTLGRRLLAIFCCATLFRSVKPRSHCTPHSTIHKRCSPQKSNMSRIERAVACLCTTFRSNPCCASQQSLIHLY